MRYDCRAAFFGVIDTQNKTIDLKYASFAGKHVEASGPLTGLNSLLESALLEQILDHRGEWMTGKLEFNVLLIQLARTWNTINSRHTDIPCDLEQLSLCWRRIGLNFFYIKLSNSKATKKGDRRVELFSMLVEVLKYGLLVFELPRLLA